MSDLDPNSKDSSDRSQPVAGESGMTVFTNWMLRLVPAFIIGRAAWMKLSDNPHASMMFEALGMEPGGRLLIGFIEAVCVVLLLTPRLSAWGAMLCLGVMVGAMIAHTTVIGFDGSLGTLFGMAVISGTASVAILYRLRSQIPFIRTMFER